MISVDYIKGRIVVRHFVWMLTLKQLAYNLTEPSDLTELTGLLDIFVCGYFLDLAN
jgi:hypothetical protein